MVNTISPILHERELRLGILNMYFKITENMGVTKIKMTLFIFKGKDEIIMKEFQ